MACFEYGTTIDLDPRETLTLPDVRGTTLRITEGTVWITQEGDSQDVVLRSGDTWVVERDGLTILEAQGAVRFCIMGRRVESLVLARGPAAAQSHWWTSVAALVATLLSAPARGVTPYV